MDTIFGEQKPVLIMFRNEETHSDAEFMRTFEKASEQSQMLFTYSGISEGYQSNLAELLAVSEEDLPTLRAFIPSQMKRYVCEHSPNDITVSQITQFVD